MTRILHLEDSPRDAEQVQDILQQAGIDCDLKLVGDRVEFESALAGTHFDLILSDFDLPGYNGMAALAMARKKQPDVPFIMVSGAMGEEAAIDSMVHGATDYVLKQRLSRLGPAVLRALTEGRERRVLRKAEADLRRMATVVRDSNDAVTIQDFEGRILAWNRGAELMYGYGEAEALEKNIDLLTAPGKVGEQRNFIRRLAAGEDITSFETQRVTRDGRVLDVWMTVTRLTDDAGNPIGLASTERDITARKREEAASRRNLRRSQAMVELLQRPGASEKELLASAVESLVEITGSEIAFLGTVDPSEQILMANLYSNRAMQECAVDGRSVEFLVATGGIWAEAIRRHQPMLVNDFEEANPLKKGTPAGHVRLRRFMGVPSIREGMVLLFAGMANKPEPYDELDLSEATLFVEGLTEAIVRKRGEIAQAESEKRYRGLFEAARDGILIVDADTGKVVDVNPFLVEMSGFRREDFLEKSLWEIQAFKSVFASDSSFTELREIGHVPCANPSLETQDGRHLDIEFLSNVCPIENRSLLQCNIRDITARRLAEESLKASDRRFISILLASQDAILLIDGEKFVECNEATVRMLGYPSRDQFLMTHPSRLSPPTQPDGRSSLEKADDMMRQAILNGYHRFEWIHRRAGGEDFPVEVSLTPINYLGRTVLHCLWHDITERKRSEAAARQQQKLESIGTLASGVAHEINNPLNVIMNYGQLILDDPADPARVKDGAESIVKESDRIAVIVRNLLSFARQDKETHSPARIDDIVERTLSLMGAVLRKDQINVQCAIPQDLPTVKCRSQQIQQVLMNLLTNARDVLNERYPTASEDKLIRIEVSAFEKDWIRWIRLTVEDHGMGIPPDVEGRVFDPFFTTKARDKGTGLGLSISHGIVKEHHGELWFETEAGKGTRFHVDLRVNNGWSVQNPGDA